ncbi:MAG: cysteine desulfurase [Ignavibacteriaceae bacterium]
MDKVIINNKLKSLNLEKIRSDFPILNTKIHGKPLCYFDNAATTQKPQIVIDKLVEYYTSMNSNVHRGVHFLSELSTKAYEDSRIKVKEFINASSEKEIIFTKGTTDSINLVAASFGRGILKEGDEVIITGMEHHSNIVPWQLIAKDKKIKLRVVPITNDGEIIFEEFEKMINEKTKLIAVVYVSNSLGTINPVEEIIETAHRFKIPVLLDGAQAIQHLNVDVQRLGCDFFAFSGHKIYGPTGIGVLYGKEKLLNEMPPYQGGGDMISKVTFEETTFNSLPYKFEAGTPNIADVIALGTAIDYISGIGIDAISIQERDLLDYATEKISGLSEVRIIGCAKKKSSVLSFIIDNIHPHDVGTFLDFEGVAIRTGHHCTQPVMDRFKIPATSRASFAFYNTKEEIDVLTGGIKKIIEVFK